MARTALLSVYHKPGIEGFAQSLVDLGWNLLASGGTAEAIAKAGIPVRDVSELVGGGAILGHRVVTLSREVHAGLLARYVDIDIAEMERLGLPFIDLVCVDLYPLEAEIARPGSDEASVIKQTDIGGPTMLRSAAKGRRIVICDPADRNWVIDWIKTGMAGENTRRELAAKAEYVVAKYCLASAKYHGDGRYAGIIGELVASCLYGENAWQVPAGLYSTDSQDLLGLNWFQLLPGSAAPSFNNWTDLDRGVQALIRIAAIFEQNRGEVPLIAVGMKHGNACGAAIGDDKLDVMQRMVTGDPDAIFGGVVVTNFAVGEAEAYAILHAGLPEGAKKRVIDCIAAPDFDEEAVELMGRKGGKCRFLRNSYLLRVGLESLDTAPLIRPTRAGFLLQPNYTFILDLDDSRLDKYGKATIEQEDDMLLAKAIGDVSNSNTITIVRGRTLIGNGVGQQMRARGAKLAVQIATESGHATEGAVAASDSFFPFLDGVEVLVKAGVKAIMGTSGSVIGDEKVIDYCTGQGIVLHLIPDKVGRGFRH